MANIEKVTIELVGGAQLTIRQDGNTVEITADMDATYEVIPQRPNRHRRLAGTVLELRFAQGKARRRLGCFEQAGED
jgi:hypothetical protein